MIFLDPPAQAGDHGDQASECAERATLIALHDRAKALDFDPETALFDLARQETIERFPEVGSIDGLNDRIGVECAGLRQVLDNPKDILKRPELQEQFPVYSYFIARVTALRLAAAQAAQADLPISIPRSMRRRR